MRRQSSRTPEEHLRRADPVLSAIIDGSCARAAPPDPTLPPDRYGVLVRAIVGPAELERIAEPWRPYRTLACVYLWRTVETTPPV
jgi:hypothetical protein